MTVLVPTGVHQYQLPTAPTNRWPPAPTLRCLRTAS